MTIKKRGKEFERKKTDIKSHGPSLTQKHFQDATTMSNIMDRYKTTGVLSSGIPGKGPVPSRRPIFGDIPLPDYQAALNLAVDVSEAFRKLPARLKSRFDNKADQLLRWVEDPANRDEALALGLIVPEQLTTEELYAAAEGKIKDAKLKVEIDREIASRAQKDAQKAPLKADPEANPGFQKKP